MKATEKLTLDQVRSMVNEKVQKAIEDREVTNPILKQSVRAGVIEAMFDVLLMSDPTEMAKRLHLADVKYIITKFDKTVNDIEGTFVAEYHYESLCDDQLNQLNQLDFWHNYVKSIKITKK